MNHLKTHQSNPTTAQCRPVQSNPSTAQYSQVQPIPEPDPKPELFGQTRPEPDPKSKSPTRQTLVATPARKLEPPRRLDSGADLEASTGLRRSLVLSLRSLTFKCLNTLMLGGTWHYLIDILVESRLPVSPRF